MLRLSKCLRTVAFAGTVGFGLLALAAPASAHTFVRCDGDRCVRVHCDWDGDDCWREPVYYRPPADEGRRWVCDEDGDDCRWVYYRERPYYDGPRLGIGVGVHL